MKKTFSKLISLSLILSMFSSIPAMAGSWRYEDPNWYNIESNGIKNTGWYTEGKNDWYYMDSKGIMQTGWIGDYHFHEVSDGNKGRMDYGWYFDGTTWYFLNTIHDGTFGAKLKGWQWIDGYCYYFDQDGKMLANTTTPDRYQVDINGRWVQNNIIQYIPGKGISSVVTETPIYSGGNSGGKTIYIGSSGGSSSNSSNNEELTEDENNNSIELKEINDFIYSADLSDILQNAQSIDFEDEKNKKIIVEQMNDYFESNDDIIKEYNWADDYNSVGIEYECGGHDIVEVWDLDKEESIPMISNIATNSNAEYIISEIDNNIMTLAEEDFDEPVVDVLLLRSFDKNDLINAKGFENALIDEFDKSEYKLNLTIIDDATVNDFKNLEGYDIVYIHAHGNFVVNGSFVDWNSDSIKELYKEEGEYVTILEEDITKEKDELYKTEYKNGLISRGFKLDENGNVVEGCYLINLDFYDYYYDTDSLENSLFSYLSCLAGVNNKLSNILFSKGAHSLIAFDDSVSFGYAERINASFIEHLLKNMTINDAWDDAISKTGTTDLSFLNELYKDNPKKLEEINSSWHGADPILAGDHKFNELCDLLQLPEKDYKFDFVIDNFDKVLKELIKKENYKILNIEENNPYDDVIERSYILTLNDINSYNIDVYYDNDKNINKLEIELQEKENLKFLNYFCELLNIKFSNDEIDFYDYSYINETIGGVKIISKLNANIEIIYHYYGNNNICLSTIIIEAK